MLLALTIVAAVLASLIWAARTAADEQKQRERRVQRDLDLMITRDTPRR